MKDNLIRIVREHGVPIAVSGVTAFAGGVALGYFLGKRKDEQEYYGVHEAPEIFNHDPARVIGEIDVVEVIDENLTVTGRVMDASAFEQITRGRELVEQILEDDEDEDDEEDRAPERVDTSVFAQTEDTWDYEKELAQRTETEPYVIHKDEFFERGAVDYTQSTLTYYAGDNIMSDDQDTPVYNFDRIVGDLKFGHGSGGDPNVFYVRNDKNQAEFEILLHEGHYAQEVHGLEPEELERRPRSGRFPLTETT